jgi:superfamily I DNA/RNA helicase
LRRILWTIFERVRDKLAERHLLTVPSLLAKVTASLGTHERPPFDYAVIDEAQDVGVPELRCLSALGAGKKDCLFFCGDLGQRIFQPPFSWRSLGVDIRGRSRTLRINYRTSHQIRLQADRLLPPELSDVDENAETRRGTISAFDGPAPEINVFGSEESEIESNAKSLQTIARHGIEPHEIGIFVRSEAQFDRARQVVEAAGLKAVERQDTAGTRPGHVAIMTMHLAKGLEFRAVLVMACDDEVIPFQEIVAAVADDADLEEVYNTERHLLYVACTRARDYLIVTGVEPASEFLDDLIAQDDCVLGSSPHN